MNVFQAILMGIVQGIAEFLPVSSSGHLAIFQNLLHIETDTGLLFDVLLHLGTLLAIFVVFWKDIWRLIVEFFGIIQWREECPRSYPQPNGYLGQSCSGIALILLDIHILFQAFLYCRPQENGGSYFHRYP